MKTWIWCTLLAALAVYLLPCAGAETTAGQPESGDIEAFLTSRDPNKVKQLKDEYDELGVRLYVIKAVGELKDKAALPLLLKALNDQHPQIRLWAALALRELGEKAAIGPLVARLDDAQEVDCYGFCRSEKMANARLGVRVRASVGDAVIEALNGLIPERKAEDKFSGIFYPTEARKKSSVFRFFGMNLPERPDTGHWGRPPARKKAAEELRTWWQKNKDNPDFGG
jgi:hypothetical protein